MSFASPKSLLLAAFALVVAVMLIPSPSVAGGDFFYAEVLDFQPEAQGEYRIALKQLTPAYGNWQISNQPMTVHLRHDDWLMRRVPSHIASREIYNKAIGLLREQISRSRFIKFGIWSDGFIPIAGKPGEYQSNSLSIEDGVVVSWPKSL